MYAHSCVLNLYIKHFLTPIVPRYEFNLALISKLERILDQVNQALQKAPFISSEPRQFLFRLI